MMIIGYIINLSLDRWIVIVDIEEWENLVSTAINNTAKHRQICAMWIPSSELRVRGDTGNYGNSFDNHSRHVSHSFYDFYDYFNVSFLFALSLFHLVACEHRVQLRKVLHPENMSEIFFIAT